MGSSLDINLSYRILSTAKITPEQINEDIARYLNEFYGSTYWKNNGDWLGEWSWHDAEEHMQEYTSKVNDVIIILSYSDGGGNVWKEYYLNGEMKTMYPKWVCPFTSLEEEG